jgi:anti-sigma B factor antagonist
MSLTAAYEIRSWEAGPQARVVTASGELDLNAAPALRETLMQLIALGQVDLIIDLGEATFIDSTVIGVLVGRLNTLQKLGGSLVMVCRNENVLRTFEIAGIARAITVHETLAEALAAPAGPR